MTKLISKKNSLEFCWRRQYSVFQAIGISQGLFNLVKKVTGRNNLVRVEGSDGWFSVYSEKGSIKKLTKGMVDVMENNPGLIEKDMRDLRETGEKWVEFTKKIKVLEKTPTKELFSIHKKFSELFLAHVVHLWKSFYYIEAVGIAFQKVLKKHFKGSDFQKAIYQFSKPSKKAHVYRISDYFKKERSLAKRVDFIKKRFPWIFTSDIYLKPVTEKEIIDYVSSFSITENNRKKDIFKISVPKELKRIIEIYQEMLYIKDKRDEYRRQAFYYIRPLVKMIMKRLNITFDQLWYIMPDELELFEKNRNKILNEIRKRKQGYILEMNENKKVFVSGGEALKNFLKDENTEGIETLKGIGGSSGKAKGKVQSIESTGEVKNFQKGRVLVSTTTNAEYISAMQKAVAFITDEGSITCHAAIVAREINKPCVVGTKIATKVLKDGDLVEVDADRGVVKVIKS